MEKTVFEIEEALDRKDHNTAAKALHGILIGFREGHHFGKLYDMDRIEPNLSAVYTRLAKCVYDLFLNCPGYLMNPQIYLMWTVYARELRAIFTIGGFYTTDFITGILDKRFNEALKEHNSGKDRLGDIEQLIMRIMLLCMLESSLQVNLTTFYNFATQVTMTAILSLLSSTVVLEEGASSRRENLLPYIQNLSSCDLSDTISLLDISVVWMMCSYLSSPDKHKIKVYLNQMLRNWLVRYDLHKVKTKSSFSQKKPVMLLGLEFFRSGHSMGRSYGDALKSLKEKFYTIGIAFQEAEKDDSNYQYFDKVITLDCNNKDGLLSEHKMRASIKRLLNYNPAVVYYPSL